MALNSKKSSQRKRDQATIELLKKLREQMLSGDISIARKAAFNLSWKQEDGLAILTEVLFGKYPRTAKKAAAYGLRSMKGRMQKMALEVQEQGLKHRDRTTKAVCIKSLFLMKGETPKKAGAGGKPKSAKQKKKAVTKENKVKTVVAARR